MHGREERVLCRGSNRDDGARARAEVQWDLYVCSVYIMLARRVRGIMTVRGDSEAMLARSSWST